MSSRESQHERHLTGEVSFFVQIYLLQKVIFMIQDINFNTELYN